MRKAPRKARRALPATIVTAAAVASLVSAAVHDTPPPKKPQPRTTYVAGGMWGG